MVEIPIQFPAPMQELQQAIAAVAQEGWGTKFTVQPLPQPGQGCRERFVVSQLRQSRADFQNRGCHHSWRQIVAGHPRFRLDWDDLDDEREHQRRLRRWKAEYEGKPQEEVPAAPTTNRWRELLDAIFSTDIQYYTSSHPRRRRV